MTIQQINYIGDLHRKLYNWREISKKSDEDFATSKRVVEVANEIVKALKNNNIKITYNNLTNSNYHFLVKVLNYNKKLKLDKNTSESLKKLRLWI